MRPPDSVGRMRTISVCGNDFDGELLGDGAVIGQGLQPRRVGVGDGEGDPRDIQEVAGREPAHLLGEVVDGVEQESLVVADGRDAAVAELDRAGDPGRAGADDRHGLRWFPPRGDSIHLPERNLHG